MKAKLITNPYIIYAIGFVIAMALYTLKWSELYPSLSFWLVLFVIATAFLSILIGLLLHKKNYISYNAVFFSPFKLWLVTLLIIVGILFECAYLHTIPIKAILSNQKDYKYQDFGIPTFHVFLVTFNSFWATFVFHNFISQKKKHLLLCYIFCLIPAIIIFSRSMIMLNLTSAFFIVFMSSKHIAKLMMKAVVIVLLLLFVFGLAGNLRESHGSSLNDVFLSLGKATPSFRQSDIPKEFFWSYIYISSPLANLQQTINIHDGSGFTWQKFGTYANKSFLPDFISKRITIFTQPDEKINKILFAFTVGSTYAICYAYIGWWGMILMFLYMMVFNMAVILLVPKRSMFFVTGISILNCIMLFSLFDNMIAYSGTSFQLFYVIVFGLLGKINFSTKRNTSPSTPEVALC